MKQLLRALALPIALLVVISSAEAQSRVVEWPTARSEAKTLDRGPRDDARTKGRKATSRATQAPKTLKTQRATIGSKQKARAKARGDARRNGQIQSDKRAKIRAKSSAPARGSDFRRVRAGRSLEARKAPMAPAAPKPTLTRPPAATHVVGQSTLRELVAGLRSRLGDVRRRLARWQASRTSSATGTAKTPAAKVTPKTRIAGKQRRSEKAPQSRVTKKAKQPTRQKANSRARSNSQVRPNSRAGSNSRGNSNSQKATPKRPTRKKLDTRRSKDTGKAAKARGRESAAKSRKKSR